MDRVSDVIEVASKYQSLTYDLQDERPCEGHFSLQTPTIADGRNYVDREVYRHCSKAGVFNRKVLILGDVLGQELLIRVPFQLLQRRLLDALVVGVQKSPCDNATDEHATADSEKT